MNNFKNIKTSIKNITDEENEWTKDDMNEWMKLPEIKRQNQTLALEIKNQDWTEEDMKE